MLCKLESHYCSKYCLLKSIEANLRHVNFITNNIANLFNFLQRFSLDM